MLLPIRAQDAVEAGFRCEIPSLIGQSRHDLAWRQTGKFLRITDFQDGRAFSRAQLVGRLRAQHERPLIRVDLTASCPAPQGPIADLQLGTGLGAPRAGGDGIIDQSNCGLAMWGADHASSSPPQIAWAFFLRMSSAAASARALSLRASSRSRSLTRFFSSFVA